MPQRNLYLTYSSQVRKTQEQKRKLQINLWISIQNCQQSLKERLVEYWSIFIYMHLDIIETWLFNMYQALLVFRYDFLMGVILLCWSCDDAIYDQEDVTYKKLSLCVHEYGAHIRCVMLVLVMRNRLLGEVGIWWVFDICHWHNFQFQMFSNSMDIYSMGIMHLLLKVSRQAMRLCL